MRQGKPWGIIIGIALFLCLQAFPSGDPDDQRILNAKLYAKDLPDPWFAGHGSPRITQVDGREELFYFFNHNAVPGLSYVMIGENLTLYANEEAAHEGYTLKLDDYFPPFAADRWQKNPPTLQFVHHADESESGCMEGSIDGHPHHVCRMLCRYGRLVIGVLGNVYEDQWLMMEEFRQVLITADEQAAAAMEDERQTKTGE